MESLKEKEGIEARSNPIIRHSYKEYDHLASEEVSKPFSNGLT